MTKKLILGFLGLFFAIDAFAQTLCVTNLRCEYRVNPIGITAASPHFSWEITSTGFNVVQKAYHILVADDPALLQKGIGNIWDSQTVNSNSTIQVPYAGPALVSTKKYYWRVSVIDYKEHSLVWSSIAQWQMGLLNTADWKGASWIAYEVMPDSLKILPGIATPGTKKHSPGTDVLPILRKSFKVSKPVKNATIFISGLGHFEMNLNGAKVGNHFLDGGWVNYQKEAEYVSFDLTELLKKGENALGIMLGNGFYFTPSGRYRKLTVAYGYPKMICRLLVQYQDGTTENIVSNTSWRTTAGPITFSSTYGGEDYDATKEQSGWDKPGFNDAAWKNAIIVDGPPQINAQTTEPIKVTDVFTAKKITQPKPGVWVYDMGQNSSGIPQITVKGKKGDTIKIVPCELLDNDGLATQKNTGVPGKNGYGHWYTYILKGNGIETWQPRFCFYGFRYLQVTGGVPPTGANPDKEPQLLAVKGLHTRNSADRVGEFSCSSDLFNKTNTLIDWAIQSNMASVLMDCPHREKLGWLEEDHLMGNSLQYNYNLATLFKKIINDMREAQTADGLIPEIAPEFTVFGDGFRDSPEWGSSSVLLPWYVYQWYGDKQVLADSYDMMQRYMAYLDKQSKNHILTQGLGDWYDLGPKHPGVSQLTSQGVTATSIYYYDLVTLSNIATLLNQPADVERYAKLAEQVKIAFNNQFFNKETKQYDTGSQTANAIAVYMKLVEPQYKAAVVDNIVKELRSHNNSLTAGDIGYRYLLKVLDDEGQSDVIFDMNSRTNVPGYGFQLAKGATALTESWQALSGVSNNHFMLGHIMEWFYAGLAGIRPADNDVAYKHIVIRPQPVGDVTSAKGSYHSMYGTIISDWKKAGTDFYLTVTIPPNTTATVYLPVAETSHVTMNNEPIENHIGANNSLAFHVGSGVYRFRAAK
ncbi:alpha-L-rhamnosidase-like protein [Mucilaginibacter gracilis]|uniref:alpha-L-rhamnosidase n=1 Tax=Mucilaginibacter gracilis TaxID=423350 RepID=A0A495J8H9_9SPHI|nr:family 78 glycoside hydrolase catalytic domain [Mucilaginibacter gracilis]RKR84349.1 alpha-L-rhamnosidase-like protein [Mucilaginibacter gracilis]